MNWIGKRIRRVEDPRLLAGRGRFVDDVDREGQLHARLVRSQIAHGRLLAVDASAAHDLPGVVTVLTAADLPAVPRIPIRLAVAATLLPRADGTPSPPLEDFLQPVLVHDVLRYVGEPIAVVVAETPYAAEDGADLVAVDVEPLAAVLDATGGVTEAATLQVAYGDLDDAFAGAANVVEASLRVGRHGAVPLETRGLVAEWDEGAGVLHIWGATKVPNFNRRLLAGLLGLRDDQVHMHQVDAGGGFGARGEFYPEDFLIPYLARRLRRPLKWIEDRAEHLVAINQSREQVHSVAAAFDADGRLRGLRDEIWHDNGAYLRTHGVAVPELTITMLPGPYAVPAYEGRIHVALTNKTPCGTYRAPGRYEGTFVREHLLDLAASRLGLDPIELRRRNLLRADQLPHTRPFTALGTEMTLDPGDYAGLLAAAVTRLGYEQWQRQAEEARASGRLVGTGLGFFLEKSGLGPFDVAGVRIGRAGDVQVLTGGTSLGQGLETVMAQIAAEELGEDPSRIGVVHTESDLVPDGMGSWASRSTVLSGGALVEAARDAAARLRRIAADLLEAEPAEITLRDGQAFVEGSRERRVSFGEIAAAAATGDGVDAGCDWPISTHARFAVDHMTYPYGVHLAQVEVDRGTGEVRVLRYAVAYEIGRAINPTLVEGQIRGGVAQGIGGALFEEFRYDPEGQPLATSFVDYLLPTAAETPAIAALVTEEAPAGTNPLGVKGAGEAGITGAGAAVANAVRNALQLEGGLPGIPLRPETVLAISGRNPIAGS